VYAWIACLSSACIVITTKLTGKYTIKNAWFFTFLWTFVIMLFTIPSSLANHAGMPHDWLPIIIAAFFAVGWNILYILAMYSLDISTLSPLFNFRIVFAILFSSLLLHEQLTTTQFIFFIIITISGLFATLDEKMSIKTFFKPAIFVGLSAMLVLALNNIMIKMALVHNDIWTANLWMSIITQVILLPTIPLFKKELTKIKLNQILPVGAMGLFQTITNYFSNIAYGVNVGITSMIMAVPLSMILAFILSFVAPKLLEKHTMKVYAVRFTAAAIMIFCALRLSS
jgi:drug/metabolite transporter (DMT)-like permease